MSDYVHGKGEHFSDKLGLCVARHANGAICHAKVTCLAEDQLPDANVCRVEVWHV